MPRVKKKYLSSFYTVDPIKGLNHQVEVKKDVRIGWGIIQVYSIGGMFSSRRRRLMEMVIFASVVDRRP
jgi:hypothetical protein